MKRTWRVNWRSVRTRLTLWNTGLLALALMGFGAAVHYTVQASFSRNIDRGLERAAGPTRHMLVDVLVSPRDERGNLRSGDRFRFRPGENGSPPSPPPPPPEEPRGPGAGPPHERGPRFTRNVRFRGRELRALLWDAKGKSLPPFVNKPLDPQAFQAALKTKVPTQSLFYSTVRDGEVPLRVLTASAFHRGKLIGVMQFAHPLEEMYDLMGELNRTLLMLIPLALLAAGAGGAFLTDRALRPVRQISQAAERVEAQDLSRRLPTAGGDEFAELASNFNRMFDRLEFAFGTLEAAYERQRQFTADASHELRTPLTTIKANTSLALHGQRTPEQYRQAIQAADGAADVMNRIVQDLLMLARSDSGQITLEGEPLPLHEVLERAVSSTSPHGDAAPILLKKGGEDLYVSGDPHHLLRLFVNLLENALRHTPEDGHITLSLRDEGEQAVVEVEDTGEGIPSEHLPHVLERFYRVDAARSRAHGGTGLGLAICQSIVEAHGGTLEVQSEAGVGTRVTVRLPLLTRLDSSFASIVEESEGVTR